MNTRYRLIYVLLTALFLAAGCHVSLDNGDITLSLDKEDQLHITAPGETTPLLKAVSGLATLTVSGEKVSFDAPHLAGKTVKDAFGEGFSMILKSESASGIKQETRVTAYDDFP